MKKVLMAVLTLCAVQAMAWTTGTGVVSSILYLNMNNNVAWAQVGLSNYVGGTQIATVMAVTGAPNASVCGGSTSPTGFKPDMANFMDLANASIDNGTKLQVRNDARAFCTGTTLGYLSSGDIFYFTRSR